MYIPYHFANIATDFLYLHCYVYFTAVVPVQPPDGHIKHKKDSEQSQEKKLALQGIASFFAIIHYTQLAI